MPQTSVMFENCPVLLFTLYNTKNIAYYITEELIFYADEIIVTGNSKNSRVFNFVILLKSRFAVFLVHKWKPLVTSNIYK